MIYEIDYNETRATKKRAAVCLGTHFHIRAESEIPNTGEEQDAQFENPTARLRLYLPSNLDDAHRQRLFDEFSHDLKRILLENVITDDHGEDDEE